MDIIVERFNKIKSNIAEINKTDPVKIVAVSKTFSLDHIMPLIEYGHVHFGENKVQEAEQKWSDIQNTKKNLKIHMIGKLQSNKAKKAVKIFDFIHSLDNSKLADICKKSEEEFNKKISYFVQINIGDETQKSGISKKDAKSFIKYCLNEQKLNIIGLMLIPPNDNNTEKYFQDISNLNYDLGFKDLSMGMSSDYRLAAKYKAAYLRIGSAILGPRSFVK